MPLVTLKSPYESWRGKSGDTVAYPILNRMFAREFVNPTNPDGANQQTVRSYLAQSAVAFQSLTPSEKNAWANLGSQMSRTDPNGNSYSLSAIQAYCAVNAYRLLDGQSTTDTAPTFTNPLAATIDDVEITSPNIVVGLSNTVSGILYYVQISPPLPGETRQAYARDLSSFSAAPNQDDSIQDASGATLNVTIPESQLPFTVAGGDRIGVRVLSLSADYVPGQRSFTTSITVVQI